MSCSNKINAFRTDRRTEVAAGESILNTTNQVVLGFVPKGGKTNEVLIKCSNKDYHTKWEDINTLIGPIIIPPFQLPINNVCFVATNGDDATALPNRLDLPYASVKAAIAAAATLPYAYVHVYTGVYITNLAFGESLLPPSGDLRMYLSAGTKWTVSTGSLNTLYNNNTGLIEIVGEQATMSINSTVGYQQMNDKVTIILDTFNIDTGITCLQPDSITFKVRNVTCVQDLFNFFNPGSYPSFANRQLTTAKLINIEIDYLYQACTTGAFLFRFNNLHGAVNVNIKECKLSQLSNKGSYFMFRQNIGVFTINIGRLIRSQELLGFTSLFGTDTCNGHKVINVDYFFTTGLIWNTYDISFTRTDYYETGSITLKGVTVAYPTPPITLVDGYFDLRQPGSKLKFILDVLNGAAAINGSPMINITNGRLQTISGKIEMGSNSTVTSGAIEYGLFNGASHGSVNSSTIAVTTACLKDLTIVTFDPTTIRSLVKNSMLTAANVPVMNTFSNMQVDPSASQVIQTITYNTSVV